MRYTEQELLNELVKCHEEHGATSEEILNDSSTDYPTQPTYDNRFGSLNEARKKAGVPVIRQGQEWTKEEVVQQIQDVVSEYGYFRLSFMDELDGPNKASLHTHFDTVEEALSTVFDEKDVDTITEKPIGYSKDELIEYMKECEDIYGRVTIDIMNNDSYMPSSYPYYKLFDNFEHAKEEAGVNKYQRKKYNYYQYTAPELIQSLKKCYTERGSTLAEDVNSFDDCPSVGVYNRRFGSIVSARNIADIPQPKIDYSERVTYETSEIIQHLKDVYESEGDTKPETLNKVEGPSPTVYQSRFDSLQTAREAAELPVTQYIKNQKWLDLVGKDLDEISGYDPDADRYVYVLKLGLRGDEAYYVGQTKNPYDRIKSYITSTPQMKLNKVTEYGLAASRRSEYKNSGATVTNVKYVISMYKKDGESEQTFLDRVREQERKESFVVAIENDCVRVFGGR